MPEMKIDLEGRERTKFSVEEMSADKIVSIAEFNDGTIIKMTLSGDKVDVECNKTLEVQPDGVTIKIK